MKVYIERETGRKYRLVRRNHPAGKCMDRTTRQRYNVIKQYLSK